MSANTRYLILGNSAAAIHAVEAIRQNDTAGEVTLAARESQHTYSRPLITYRLAGDVTVARMDYRPRDFYQTHSVRALLGLEARRVDVAGRRVQCADGKVLDFDKLLIATGGAPIRPPIPGLDSPGVFNFTTWADQQAVEAYMQTHGTPRHAVVLGGGLIGLKTVEALAARAIPCTLVELADRILPITFDQTASRLAAEALARKGVTLRTANTVKEILTRDGLLCGVMLKDRERLDCDLLIVAIGVRPDLSLVAGENIETDRGIIVDDHMETTAAGIFAAGDVAQARDALSGENRLIPILPAAARQGRIAGINMAGGTASYEGAVPMNAVDVLGLPTVSVGQTIEQPGDEVLSDLDRKGNVYRKLVLRDNRLVGAIFVGRIDRAGIFTGLIRSRLDVRPFKSLLLTDGFGLLSLPAEYRLHMVSGAGIEV